MKGRTDKQREKTEQTARALRRIQQPDRDRQIENSREDKTGITDKK